jgi:hypothetical protein
VCPVGIASLFSLGDDPPKAEEFAANEPIW